MKKLRLVPIVSALAVAAFVIAASRPSPKTQWMNDAVYYDTNSMVWDDERNKTLPTNATFFYTKTVVTTNKATPFYFRFGDRPAELGARGDGVVVWRYCK